MSVDGATVTSGDAEHRMGEVEEGENGGHRFRSARVLHELIGTDAQHEAEAEGFARLASTLLHSMLTGLHKPAGLLLSPLDLSCIAAEGFSDEERGLLAAPGSAFESLARRALVEQRAFLFGRATPEPTIARLREIRPDRVSVALVPLYDRERACGVLVLASPSEHGLTPTVLRWLAPAFRLLALLLHPGRLGPASAAIEDPGASASENEQYVVEIEDLRGSLGEARTLLRQLEERVSSSEAAHRADVETWRARVSELEAKALSSEQTSWGREELEAECQRWVREVGERDERIRALQSEVALLRERVTRTAAPSPKLTDEIADEFSDELSVEVPDEASLDDSDDSEIQLGEIAEAAAAAIGELERSVDEPLESTVEGEEEEERVNGFSLPEIAEPEVLETELAETELTEAELEPELEPALEVSAAEEIEIEHARPAHAAPSASVALWHVDLDDESRGWVAELARATGAELWTGEGDPPPASRSILAMNLFDGNLERALDLSAGRTVDCVAYGVDPESGMGIELGSVGWVRRPLDPAAIVSRLRGTSGRRLTGIVLVSAHLRELAPLRQALAEVDAAGSVACDARQATEILEIVRRPDAVLIDLELEGGQGFAIAKQLRKSRETMDIPIVFLLAERIDPARLLMDAQRGRVLEAYSHDDARRLINGALARRV